MNRSKFDFYDIVTIKSFNPQLKPYYGLEAVIRGKSQSEEDPALWAYGAYIFKAKEVYCINEEDLEYTGKKMPEGYNMTGESLHVQVDPETGEGIIVDDKESPSPDTINNLNQISVVTKSKK